MVRQAISNDAKLVTIRVRHIAETEHAVCVLPDGGKKVWLPKGQIEVQRESSPYCTVDLPEWLAIEKGLENEVD